MTADLSLLLGRSVAAVRDNPREARKRFHEAAVRNDPNPACPNCGKRHRKLTVEECADRQMSEAKLTERVLYRAHKYGWKGAHAGRLYLPPSKENPGGLVITPMAPGWPDWCFAKAGYRLVFMELKKELGKVEPEQWEWLQLLNRCGARAVLVRPSDLREGRVEAIFRNGSPLPQEEVV